MYVCTGTAGQRCSETKLYSARVMKNDLCQKKHWKYEYNVNTNINTIPPIGEIITIHAHMYTHTHTIVLTVLFLIRAKSQKIKNQLRTPSM